MDLATHKALGDESRFALFRELVAVGGPCTAQQLADRLELHPNTVRLHLERLREVGLVEVEAEHRGRVGRPQHRYTVASPGPDRPGAAADGVAQSDEPLRALAGVLAGMAAAGGLGSDEALEAGRDWGRSDAAGCPEGEPVVARLQRGLERLGFDVSVGESAGSTRISFDDCPFRELAERHPELVCNLHRGFCEGLAAVPPAGRVEAFVALRDGTPCGATVRSAL
ncbi:MAG: helix-turn-helix domain-containing protein [Acidimicrobiia bacterium]